VEGPIDHDSGMDPRKSRERSVGRIALGTRRADCASDPQGGGHESGKSSCWVAGQKPLVPLTGTIHAGTTHAGKPPRHCQRRRRRGRLKAPARAPSTAVFRGRLDHRRRKVLCLRLIPANTMPTEPTCPDSDANASTIFQPRHPL
jgi:hypothetical protein